jgi:methyltransferase
MTARVFAAAVIFGLLLAEQRLSRANEHALRDAGAIAPPGDPFLALAILYPAAFLLMSIEGVWRAGQPTAGPAGGPSWAAAGVVLFVASKALKYWAIRALGLRWSFGIRVLPGQPLVRTGPYRYVAHPNYVAVIGELVGTAMMMGARIAGPIMTLAFGWALMRRLRFETRVLSEIGRAGGAQPSSEEKGPRHG